MILVQLRNALPPKPRQQIHDLVPFAERDGFDARDPVVKIGIAVLQNLLIKVELAGVERRHMSIGKTA